METLEGKVGAGYAVDAIEEHADEGSRVHVDKVTGS